MKEESAYFFGGKIPTYKQGNKKENISSFRICEFLNGNRSYFWLIKECGRRLLFSNCKRIIDNILKAYILQQLVICHICEIGKTLGTCYWSLFEKVVNIPLLLSKIVGRQVLQFYENSSCGQRGLPAPGKLISIIYRNSK